MSFLLELCCCCLVENQDITTNITNTLSDVNDATPVGILPHDNSNLVDSQTFTINNSQTNTNITREANDVVQHVSIVSILS